MTDLHRIEAILAELDPMDAVILSAVISEPAWRKRARRLEARDDAIRAALTLLLERGARNDATAAAELERRLKRHSPRASEPDELPTLLYRIVTLNNGRERGLGQVQLARIGRGARTPETTSFSPKEMT